MTWTSAAPAVMTAFLGSLVEAVEAMTIVLAVTFVRGLRPAAIGAVAGFALLALNRPHMVRPRIELQPWRLDGRFGSVPDLTAPIKFRLLCAISGNAVAIDCYSVSWRMVRKPAASHHS